jgi:hypothetical protein
MPENQWHPRKSMWIGEEAAKSRGCMRAVLAAEIDIGNSIPRAPYFGYSIFDEASL